MNWFASSDPIEQARGETWIYQGDEGLFDEVKRKWGGCGLEQLSRMLREADGKEQVFAILALGLLAPEGVEELLVPFLQSGERIQRWAAVLALARLEHPGLRETLQDLLEDGLSDVLDWLDEGIEAAITEQLAATPEHACVAWEQRLAPATWAAWKNILDQWEDYQWYLFCRCRIALLLGSWGDGGAVAALRQVLFSCEKLIPSLSPFFDSILYLKENLLRYESHLAYALGQLGAFGIFLNLGLTLQRQKSVLTYLLLGACQISPAEMFWPHFSPDMLKPSEQMQMHTLLRERFGWSQPELEAYFSPDSLSC